ncbi:MAG TPA: hypothetical protein VK515_08435 [Rhizomicrobium sp.]|nr:hypothetical protein [Rhizomicrobium sp.]
MAAPFGGCEAGAMWDGMTLVAGRDCGDCTVCCTAPSIDKPEIQKLSGATCKHCTSGGCGIYETRFPVCRSFYCAWRTVDIFSDDWRPDRSGVMPYVETEGISQDFDLSTGIGLMLVGHPLKIVRQKWFQDFVVTGVMSSVPLFLSLPGPRGYQAATVSLNTDEMLAAIARGSVKDALESVVQILRGWDFQPAAITHIGNDVSA